MRSTNKGRSVAAHLAYLRYLARHKWYVLSACKSVGASTWAGLVHDLSKFLPSEWLPYLRTFYDASGGKQYEPGPDFSMAWLLHQRRNPHHWQAWILRNDDGTVETLPMPERFAREMVADWIGAGRAISGRQNPRPWYEDNKHKMQLHPDTRRLVERVMAELEKGTKQ